MPDAASRYNEFLAANFHGTMGWMADRLEWRTDLPTLWPEARSAIILAMSYGQETEPLAELDRPDRGNLALYARGRDYHKVVKGALKRVAQKLAARGQGAVKVFVDTGPVLEKPLAQAAGLGWQGKHTNLVSRDLGSWFFLGEILTNIALPPDPPMRDHCGRCRQCLDICPTGAFPAPYKLDARRCISYLTIEHEGPIPLEFREPMGNRIFGCDDCLAVCPWNKFAQMAGDARLNVQPGLNGQRLDLLAALDDRAFRQIFTGTAIKRTGRNRFVRNVLVAIGNSGDRSLLPSVQGNLDDPDPVVRAMAVWALKKLTSCQEFAPHRAARRDHEPSTIVLEEWDR